MVIIVVMMLMLMFTLRYPMDFTFHLQNFSALNYVKTVKSKQQVMIMMMYDDVEDDNDNDNDNVDVGYCGLLLYPR